MKEGQLVLLINYPPWRSRYILFDNRDYLITFAIDYQWVMRNKIIYLAKIVQYTEVEIIFDKQIFLSKQQRYFPMRIRSEESLRPRAKGEYHRTEFLRQFMDAMSMTVADFADLVELTRPNAPTP